MNATNKSFAHNIIGFISNKKCVELGGRVIAAILLENLFTAFSVNYNYDQKILVISR